MNKTAIKNFAVRARNKLIEDITQKVYELGITKSEIKDIETFEGGFRVKGLNNRKTYKKYEIKQRDKLISNIKDKGYEQVIEEVAYTWFNRFIALRFMEVNEYLPTGIRVLSSNEEGKTEPDIIKEVLNVGLDIDKDIVYRLIDEHDTDDLYKYLLIRQCNQLGKIMPMVFEEIADYTELLLPDNLLFENSVIRDLVVSIDEEDYKDQVEIIGWMYQYYISEKKEEVFADLKKNKKITKENIPAATQLFTPKWIVKYMVENSLGRLWLESHPDEDLKAQWKYCIEEAEQEPEAQKKLEQMKNPNLNPEDIKVLDPACGSAHILVYAFDVLYDIYLKVNYSERDIPHLILEKNLYGLDIDDRAGQLASFALMMKARSKNKRIFRKKIDLNVCSIQESNGITKEVVDYFVGNNENLREDVEYLIDVFKDAKEYGSIIDVKKVDFELIKKRLKEIIEEDTKVFDLENKEVVLDKMPGIIMQGKIMSDKYEIVCANPPYMSNKGMNNELQKFINNSYQDSKKDIFAVFIEKAISMTRKNFYTSMITMQSWMFLSSYENFRQRLINNVMFESVVHLGFEAFEEISGKMVQTVAFVVRNLELKAIKPVFIRLVDFYDSRKYEKETQFFNNDNRFCQFSQNDFEQISGTPIVYWLSKQIIESYKENYTLDRLAEFMSGKSTGNNDYYLREWYEVSFIDIGFNNQNPNYIYGEWIPINRGGSYRRWYGNLTNVVRKEFCNNSSYFFSQGITWTDIANEFCCRFLDKGFASNNHGKLCFVNNDIYEKYLLGFLNTVVARSFVSIFTTKAKYETGYVQKIALNVDDDNLEFININVENNILISRKDWDSFEISWDFKRHPFLLHLNLDDRPIKLDTIFNIWETETDEEFEQLLHNEEELNRTFIEIYGLQDELAPEVEEKDITIRKTDRERDIKSLISYAVGCMFGRYSLDEDELIYAGGEFEGNRYKKFIPTTDNVLVIADDDYFEDDIVNRFVEFVKVTFGKETLEENLDYIAETLGVKTSETSRQAIRRYFLKDFYNDHVKMYKKKPIYWQFDSGNQNGFKALIYMHRYDSSTVARVRIDYLHKLQRKYEAEVSRLELMLETDLSTRDAAAARKKIDSIKKQIQECLAYDQVIAHVANQRIEIDLDDGVKVNYAKFQDIEVPQGEGKKPKKANLLSKI